MFVTESVSTARKRELPRGHKWGAGESVSAVSDISAIPPRDVASTPVKKRTMNEIPTAIIILMQTNAIVEKSVAVELPRFVVPDPLDQRD
jgi:hypothetical protein